MNEEKRGVNTYIIRYAGIILLSIIVAIVLAKTGILADVLTATQTIKFIGSFLAGLFFISIFTAAPATVIIFELVQTNSIWEVAFFGGLGALIGDLIIFKFVKDVLANDLLFLVRRIKINQLSKFFKFKTFKLLILILGAIILASPLPDELGLVLMGVSRTNIKLFVPLSFILNFFGILVIGLIAKN